MDIATIINIILCILSFILAAVSVVMVVITLRQNSKMIEESTRPFITVYTEEINVGDIFFYLVVKNFGKSAAFITKFKYDFDFKGCYRIGNDRDYLMDIDKAVIAPGQSRICMLDYSKIDREVTFNIEYHSTMGKKYKETYTMDIKAGASMPTGKIDTKDKEFRTISYTLQEMLQKSL